MSGQLPWGASSLNALLLFLNMNFVLLQENEKSRIIPLEAMEQHKNEGRETHKIKQTWRHSNHVYCTGAPSRHVTTEYLKCGWYKLRKTSTSPSLTMLKPLSVDHNKL